MGKHLSQYEMGLIWAYRHPKPRLSFARIAKKLKKGKSTIVQAHKRMEKRGNPFRKGGSGRPKVTTMKQDKKIILHVKRNPFASAKKIKKELELKCSNHTIRRSLVSAGLKSYFTRKKPFISEKNRRKRLIWAKQHRHWTIEDWRKVLFSDESAFTLRY